MESVSGEEIQLQKLLQAINYEELEAILLRLVARGLIKEDVYDIICSKFYDKDADLLLILEEFSKKKNFKSLMNNLKVFCETETEKTAPEKSEFVEKLLEVLEEEENGDELLQKILAKKKLLSLLNKAYLEEKEGKQLGKKARLKFKLMWFIKSNLSLQ